MKYTSLLFVFFLSTLGFAQKSLQQTKELSSKPFVLGTVEELQSTILGEKRILNIYLPEGYDEKDTTRYPVIYLLDGSADEDFIHVVGLVQFNTFPWIDRMQKCIVVGIATVDRRRDFTFPTKLADDKKKNPTSGSSEKFISFIEKELQPFIEKKFKTNSGKALIGQSLGGLLAMEILLKKSNLFDTYLIISPSIWWDNASLLNLDSDVLSENFPNKKNIYIAVGKEGLTPTEMPRVMEVDANFLAEKLKKAKNKNLNVYLDYLPEEDHATVGHQAIANAIKNLLFSKR